MSDEDEWLPYEDEEGGDDADEDKYEDEAKFFRDRRAASRELDDDEEGEDGDVEQEYFFGDQLDPFSVLEGMGAQQHGSNAVQTLQPYEILAMSKRQARTHGRTAVQPAGPASSSEDEEEAKRPKKGSKKAVFGATMNDIWDEEVADELGLSKKGRKKQRDRAKRRRKAQAQGKRTKQLPEEVTRRLGEANLMYATSRYQEAIALLTDVVKLAPNLPDPYHTLGLLYEAAGDPRKALDFYMIAAHMTPKEVALWKRLAALSSEMGFIRQAIYCLSKVVARDKEDMDARWDRAVMYNEIGEPRKAVEAFEAIVAQRPDDPEGPKMLAKLYHQLDQPERAVAVLEAYIRDFPLATDLTHVNILCELYMEDGTPESYKQAAELIERTAKLLCGESGLPIDLQVKAGMCVAHLGDLDWAMQTLQALLQEPVEEFHDLYLDTADLLLTLGQPNQALLYYARVMEQPELSNPALWAKMVECHTQLGNLEDAVRVYSSVLEDPSILPEGQQEAAMALAELFCQAGKHEESLDALRVLDEREELGLTDAAGTNSLDMLGRRTQLLLRLGHLEGYLDVMLPVVKATLKHFEASSEAGGQQDPKLLSRAKRRSKYAQRSQTFQEHGAVFKGFVSRDRRKAHVREADEKLLEAMAEQPDREEGEPPPGGHAPLLADIVRDDAQFEALIKTARVLLACGRAAQAAQLVEECIVHFGRRWQDRSKKDSLRMVAAEAALAMGDPAAAMQAVRYACARWPHSTAAWNSYCRTAAQLGGLRQSLKFMSTLCQKVHDSLPLQLMLGHCHALNGAHGQALAEYMTAYSQAPDEPLTLLCIGVAHLNQAMSRKVPDRDAALLAAFAFIQNYAKRRGNQQEGFYNLGRAAHQVGLLHLAAPWYQRCLAAEPAQPSPSSSGNQDPASLDLRREAAHNLALIYRSSGADDLARQLLRTHLTV